MRRNVIFALMCVFMATIISSESVMALGLKVAPLEYKTTLKTGERKQGVVDISNPATEPVEVAVSVRAFRQINDNGGLEFYNDEAIENGIRPELTTITLGPREAVRMAFSVNGNMLPKGDVFAAILFSTQPVKPQNGVGQQVRVGTLLSIVNAQPGARSARIPTIRVPFIQVSSTIQGSYSVQNTAAPTSGFYPVVTISSWPGGNPKQVTSSLVFGGRTRSNEFTYGTGYGLHRIDVSYGNSMNSQWVLTIAPWMILLALFIASVIGVELTLLRRRRTHH